MKAKKYFLVEVSFDSKLPYPPITSDVRDGVNTVLKHSVRKVKVNRLSRVQLARIKGE